MELLDNGTVLIFLATSFAPKAVAMSRAARIRFSEMVCVFFLLLQFDEYFI